MAPYQRGAGMTEVEAERLAAAVLATVDGSVTIAREGRFYVVTVETPDGTWSLRDEEDWRWLRRRLAAGG